MSVDVPISSSSQIVEGGLYQVNPNAGLSYNFWILLFVTRCSKLLLNQSLAMANSTTVATRRKN
jgi:hypothetical protein